MKSIWMLLSVALGLAGCGYSSEENTAIERVKSQLSDPESAQFRNVHEGVERKNGWIVCGEVNAKNKFGGYTGFKKFSATEKEGDVLIADSDSVEGVVAGALIENVCKFPKAA